MQTPTWTRHCRSRFCFDANSTGKLLQRTTCLTKKSLDSADGIVVDITKVTKVAIERILLIKEIEGTVGLARPTR